jgi:hypothetical protein
MRSSTISGCTSIKTRVKNFLFSVSSRPALGPPNLLSNGYRGLFPRGWSGRGVKLTTHFQLVPRSRKFWSLHPLPIHLHGVVLNYLLTRTTLPFTFTSIKTVWAYLGRGMWFAVQETSTSWLLICMVFKWNDVELCTAGSCWWTRVARGTNRERRRMLLLIDSWFT